MILSFLYDVSGISLVAKDVAKLKVKCLLDVGWVEHYTVQGARTCIMQCEV